MKTVKIAFFMFLVLSVFLLSGNLLAQDLAKEQVLVKAITAGDVTTLDPSFVTTGDSYPIVDTMFNGLVNFPPGIIDLEKIEPELAESYEVSEDGLVWTFYLRQGVQFHHGYGEFTSADVVFSINRVRDPQVGSPWRATYGNIKEIEAKDRYTVTIELFDPDPFMLLKLVGFRAGQILSKKAVEELGDDFRFNPIGTGPFMFKEYSPREKIVLERNEDYFKGAPYLEEIHFLFMPDLSAREMALRTGEVHVSYGLSEQTFYDRMKRLGLVPEPISPGRMMTLHYNLTKEPFDDVRVRQALSHAINREEIVESFYGIDIGLVENSPVPKGYFGHTTDIPQYPYDPERAKELLAEAGYPNGFSFDNYSTAAPDHLAISEIIQDYWSRIGVEMNLNVVDHTTWHAMIRDNQNYAVVYSAERLPIADIYLTEFYHSDSIIGKPTAITNFTHLGDVIPGIDSYLEEARFEMDVERQLELYRKAQYTIMEQCVAFPLFTRRILVVRQPYVELGYEPDQVLFICYIYNETVRLLEH